jgi:hypothetical protein
MAPVANKLIAATRTRNLVLGAFIGTPPFERSRDPTNPRVRCSYLKWHIVVGPTDDLPIRLHLSADETVSVLVLVGILLADDGYEYVAIRTCSYRIG